eukprot:scpid83359/ scgid26596/ 
MFTEAGFMLYSGLQTLFTSIILLLQLLDLQYPPPPPNTLLVEVPASCMSQSTAFQLCCMLLFSNPVLILCSCLRNRCYLDQPFFRSSWYGTYSSSVARNDYYLYGLTQMYATSMDSGIHNYAGAVHSTAVLATEIRHLSGA